MHLYASNVQATRVTLNWRYNENPPVGNLVAFYISCYLQDERHPNLNGQPIFENLLYSVSNPKQTDFSYMISDRLLPGVSYNLDIAAVTEISENGHGGAGPIARMSFTTLRTGVMNS